MKAGSRPQYYRIRRMVQMVREGAAVEELVDGVRDDGAQEAVPGLVLFLV
jgi:hypothetical protein